MTAPATPEPKRPWFEPAAAIVMALASFSTAWCSYQSTRWSGEGNALGSQADRLEREAFAQHLEAGQIQGVQMRTFMEAMDAQMEGDEKRARFYTDRFDGALKPAYEKWIARKPFENPAAPPHPFTPEFYVPPLQQEIMNARAESRELAARSNAASHTAGSYLVNTVLLASVLFFAGTSSKFDQRRVRWGALGFAIVLLLYVVTRMLMLHVA